MINSFTPATTILSSQVNANNVDFATGLSNVLTRDNQAPMTAPLRLADGSQPLPGLQFANDTNTGLRRSGSDEMRAVTGGLDAMRWDAAQKVWALGALDVAGLLTALQGVIGHNAAITVGGFADNIQSLAAGPQGSVLAGRFSADTSPARLRTLKSRGATIGSHVIVQSGDALGSVLAFGSDGSAFHPAAEIQVFVDGTPGVNDMPGAIALFTTPDGSALAVERMAIRADGRVQIPNRAAPLIQLHGGGFVDLNEIAPPANPAANVVRMYGLDVGGLSRLAYRDSAGTQLVLGVSQVDRQVFTSGGTWNKPAQGTVAYVQMWGGGGGGGIQGANGGGGGGGGGAYSEKWFALSALGATEAVVVGAGGAGRLIAAGNGIGAPGASSTFDNLTAYAGGAGGGGSTASGGGGGGGGGLSSVGANGAATGGGAGGTPRPNFNIPGAGAGVFGGITADTDGNSNPFGGGAGGSSATTARAGGGANWGGGGGGGGPDAAGPGAAGGDSVFGGGGGGGGGASVGGGDGGPSVFGGAGGAGGVDATPGTAGTIPSGAGGGAESANAGNGARGEVIVTVF